MKKLVTVLIAGAIVATACRGATSTIDSADATAETKTPRPKPTQVKESKLGVDESELQGLTIDVWYPWFGVEADFFESLTEEFNRENTWGIQVIPSGQINFSYLYENVTNSLPTPKRPNMIIALPEHAASWHAEQLVANLTPYVGDPKYGLVDASDIPIVFWNQDISAEARVGFPAQHTARFLLWNQTWAKELGFSKPPDTAEDFQRQSCAAHQTMVSDAMPENDGKGGWIVDTQPMTAYAWLLAFQGGVLESNDYRFLTPNNISAFKFVRTLAETGCAWQTTAGDSSFDEFASRSALFVTASLEDLPEQSRAMASAGSSDLWRVIPFPGDAGIPVYGSTYIILKSAPTEQLAAWLFVKWLTDAEQDARWVETTHLFPLRKSTLDLLGDYRKSHPQWAEAVELLPQGELAPGLASWRTVKVMLGDGFNHMFHANVPSGQVAAILAQMESTSRELEN